MPPFSLTHTDRPPLSAYQPTAPPDLFSFPPSTAESSAASAARLLLGGSSFLSRHSPCRSNIAANQSPPLPLASSSETLPPPSSLSLDFASFSTVNAASQLPARRRQSRPPTADLPSPSISPLLLQPVPLILQIQQVRRRRRPTSAVRFLPLSNTAANNFRRRPFLHRHRPCRPPVPVRLSFPADTNLLLSTAPPPFSRSNSFPSNRPKTAEAKTNKNNPTPNMAQNSSCTAPFWTASPKLNERKLKT